MNLGKWSKLTFSIINVPFQDSLRQLAGRWIIRLINALGMACRCPVKPKKCDLRVQILQAQRSGLGEQHAPSKTRTRQATTK